MVPETVRRALRSPARSTHANIFTNGFVVRYSGSARWGSSGCGAGKAPGRPNAGGGVTPEDPRTAPRGQQRSGRHGIRYGEVVQRREGVRVHHGGGRGGGVPPPRRGAAGGVRGHLRPEGEESGERPQGLNDTRPRPVAAGRGRGPFRGGETHDG